MPELIINEDTYRDWIGDGQVVEFDGHVRQLCAKPRRTEFGGLPCAPAFSAADLIPRSEWDRRIAEKDAAGSWLGVLLRDDRYKVPCKNQNGLNYCHGYGPTHAAEIARMRHGHEYVELSAESVAGPVTNWRNVGWDPEDDFQHLVDFGACPATFMDKPWSRSPKLWKPGWQDAALDYRVEQWADMTIKGYLFEACVTCALRDEPAALGFDWWHHEIMGCLQVRKRAGKYEILHRNNWGPSWGDDGFGWFTEGPKAIPSYGIFAIRAMRPFDRRRASQWLGQAI